MENLPEKVSKKGESRDMRMEAVINYEFRIQLQMTVLLNCHTRFWLLTNITVTLEEISTFTAT